MPEVVKEIITQLLQSNPGFASLVVSGFLLPLLILVLNNRQNKRIKELEGQNDLSKIRATKELEKDLAAQEKQRSHEDVVISSLYKILFEVQRLHIDLSASCVDYQCIDRAVGKFQTAFEKYQGIISDNQIFLSSKVTDHLYQFYQSLAELLIELQELRAANKPDLALVSVYQHSEHLSEQVVSVQEAFVLERPSIAKKFNKDEMRHVLSCCGSAPRVADREALNALLEELKARKGAENGEARKNQVSADLK